MSAIIAIVAVLDVSGPPMGAEAGKGSNRADWGDNRSDSRRPVLLRKSCAGFAVSIIAVGSGSVATMLAWGALLNGAERASIQVAGVADGAAPAPAIVGLDAVDGGGATPCETSSPDGNACGDGSAAANRPSTCPFERRT